MQDLWHNLDYDARARETRSLHRDVQHHRLSGTLSFLSRGSDIDRNITIFTVCPAFDGVEQRNHFFADVIISEGQEERVRESALASQQC